MTTLRYITRTLRRFGRKEDGVALVEFAILLPIMLLIFAVVIEGGRMLWAYQATISGVRDATRYVARIAPADICITSSSSPTALNGHAANLLTIIRNSHGSSAQGAVALFPASITVTSVVPTLKCVTGTYRISPVGVAQVRANLTITFPFAGVFTLNGGSLSTITTHVTDESRIFGT